MGIVLCYLLMSNIQRRIFLKQAGILSSGLLFSNILTATEKKAPVILIVSGWQDVNIGDIAHTPGLIALLKEQIPSCRIILWKKSRSEKVERMLNKYYPDVEIVHEGILNYAPINFNVKKAFAEADFMIHGSGPSLVAQDFLTAWHKQTQKPFGVIGVTIDYVGPAMRKLLSKAAFVYTRETSSIEILNRAGLQSKSIAFAPDATFALTIHDKEKANNFLKANQLEAKKFICVIPRLRKTPYHSIRENSGWSAEKIKEVEDLNDKYKEKDHAKLREAMVTWVRKTGNKVLVCPEMTYQVDIMDELLIDKLPEDIKPHVIKRGYWLPDEAASVYAQAHTVLSFECHSPIIAAVNGTPCFYLRQPEDTIKGQMYYDLGLKEWTFEIDSTTGEQISKRLMEVHDDYPTALTNLSKSMMKVNKRYKTVFKLIRSKIYCV